MSTHSSKGGFPNKNQHQKYIPKQQQQSNNNSNSNSNSTLSNSLRHQQSSSSSSGGDRITNNSNSGKFVNYLPQDEAVAAGFGSEEGGLDPVESQKVVDFLNQECSRLLKLNPKDFWTQVASDTSLHAFLESFLKFRSRWYDFPYRGTKGTVAGVIVGEHELSRRVFMILYRMSSNRDPGAKVSDSLSAKDHAVILQEKKLLDLPKLLDICAIYGYENEELTRSIVTNAVKAQPSIHDSFSAAISHFLNIVHTMYERCTTSLEVLLLSSHQAKDNGSTRLHTDYLEVIDFINDAIVSMDALVAAYKHAAVYFSCPVLTSYGSDELLKTLARLHDSLLPTLQHGFKIIFSRRADDMLPNVIISLKMLSSRIANFCWKLLNLCYLTEELFKESILLPSGSKVFPAQVEDPVIRADILIQTFRDISEECSTVQNGSNMNLLLQSVEKNYQLMGTLERLGNEGWISMDNEQLQFLSRIMSVSISLSTNISHLSSNKVVEMDEDSAILESKISQVKDLFPDYGKGFISACLEVYNYNPEEVIQRILEANLHSDLLSLDTSLDVAPPKTAPPPPANVKDKGKGKLIEHSMPTSTSTSALAPTPRPAKVLPASSTSSSAGRFIRKSEANAPDNQVLESIDESVKKFALKSLLEYEDEYDDSFDDLGLGVGDSGPDDLSERVSSSETSASDASRWGSRQKPQFFVKDGKNYSYKVSGSVAAANYNEASIVNQAQKESIHGLGRGGNIPFGAAQKVMELNEVKQGEQDITGNSNRRGGGRNSNKKDHNAPMKSSEGQYNEQHHAGGRGRGWGRGNTGKEQTVTGSNDGRYDEQRQVGGRGREREWGRDNSGKEQTVTRSNEGRYDEQRQVGGRGREREWGRGNIGKEQNAIESNEGEESNESVSERGRGGRGTGGRRGGGRRDNYRKDQAMKKHFSGLGAI